jgi:PleD family two-component response regulator
MLGGRWSARYRANAVFSAVPAPDENAVMPIAVASVIGSSGNCCLTGIDVLVVDDQEDSLDILRHLLEHAGAAVRTAINAEDALTQWEVHEPDLLVADIGLPSVDGYACGEPS